MADKRLRILVVFGGRSGEHEVSLQSGRAVMAALEQAGHHVIPLGITRQGRWLLGGDPLHALMSGEAGGEKPVSMLPEPGRSGLVSIPEREDDLEPLGVRPKSQKRPRTAAELRSKDGPRGAALAQSEVFSAAPLGGRPPIGSVDLVFPVLHGTYGEDGTVQGLFELASVAYAGAGVLGSALGMDKVLQKTLWRGMGLPVVDFVVIRRQEVEGNIEAVLNRVEAAVGYPCFTKPANLGSSVGVSKARDRVELETGLSQAARYDAKLLVERGIDARELECGVLGNDEPIASVVGEILPGADFYDYRAKYLDTGSQALIPADITPETADEVRRMAVAAFKAIDGSGLARVDFFLERGTGRLFLNEINTMPGFTQISMYPKLWEASGVSFSELVTRIARLGLERFEERARNQTSRET